MSHSTSTVGSEVSSIHESLKSDFDSGLITLEEVALEFHVHGWRPYVDIAYAKQQLRISHIRRHNAKV